MVYLRDNDTCSFYVIKFSSLQKNAFLVQATDKDTFVALVYLAFGQGVCSLDQMLGCF